MADGIKIKGFFSGVGDPRLAHEGDRAAGTEGNKEAFLAELRKARVGRERSDLQEMLARIDESANALAQNQTVGNFKKYRELVKKFLAQVVGGAYQLREESGWDRRGRHKSLITVEKVDHHLEEMATQFFSQQAEPIDVLAKIGEIRGLLLDIIT
ncbi:DUF327 family protein [Heliobacterium gestii]|uniref:DUF327 family protein n=1 Tax=Heliomicrobium gestii TaxID=2699 RepID=A0A845LE05_HELGE|nr:YaaR family protein [Heliomicrobium gestii]MBM7866356.1 uncharacterized protein YaaR (DUF327 family) [Heliomicrobium gestii]MZP42859.1 DUF327 family protein [Heliomicrobium gestii]